MAMAVAPANATEPAPTVVEPGMAGKPTPATPAAALSGVERAAGTGPRTDAAAVGAVPAGTQVAAVAGQPLAPAVATSGPVQAPAHVVPVPAGFAAQLARPVFTLASAGRGEHTMTVAVNPENLGPVTVQAHISASGVRVELFAASPDGRDVLRQILPDLKRDLAGSGLNATLDLSSGGHPSGGQPGGGHGSRDEFMNRRAPAAYPGATDNRQSPVNSQASRVTPGLRGTDGTLDVMA
jgi:flagellar hook-length control protein FliK